MIYGIDIGTGSVRSYSQDNKTYTRPIETIKHNHRYVTQSSKQIYDSIVEIIDDASDICFTATCSMVVKTVVIKDGKKYLAPFNCGLNDDHEQDIILWMDNRAVDQCQALNKVDSTIKSTINNFIPELGIPKLKWLSDQYGVDDYKFGQPGGLYCFELYDWFNYAFQIGYEDNLVEFKLRDLQYRHGTAIDGSIKGWTSDALAPIKLKLNIIIGKAESILRSPSQLMYLGEIINDEPPFIHHGCIDAYSGWVSSLTNIPNLVSMIAGTSTCFILESDNASINGTWGPFELIKHRPVLAFGQPATGKLFEVLFHEYRHLSPTFDMIEQATHQLEIQHHQSINELIKHYFYYGDKFGNRSPLNKFNMNEMFIDGVNCNNILGSVFNNDLPSLIIKYNLILEFLAFQLYQIFTPLPIDNIVIMGLQVLNSRLLKLIHMVTGKNIYIINHTHHHGLNVAKGAMKLASNLPLVNDYEKLEFHHDARQQAIIDIKKHTITQFSDLQLTLTQLYDGVPSV